MLKIFSFQYLLVPNFPTFKNDLAGNLVRRWLKIFLYLEIKCPLFEQEKRKYDNHKNAFSLVTTFGHLTVEYQSPHFYESA